MNTKSASFREFPPGFYSGVETIVIADEENEGDRFSTHVMITEADEWDEEIDILNLELRHGSLLAPFNDIQFFGDFVVIGLGDSVYLYNLKTKSSFHHALGAYFGSLYIEQERLYVCSVSDIRCFNKNGEKLWVSDPLGVDGVIIEKVTNKCISGSAECDPPDGWESFEISTLDGKRTTHSKEDDQGMTAITKENDRSWLKKLGIVRLFKNCFLLLLLLSNISQAQTLKQRINFPYYNACLIIEENPLDPRVPYDIVDILLFENDSLFRDIRWLETGTDTIALSQDCLSQSLVRIEIKDYHEYIYLLDANKKALAICYPNETEYELQWLSNGKNSMLKQWEMVTININYDFDLSMENLYISYEDVIFERLIDRDGNPEDFELSIAYWDKNGDGQIECKISKTHKRRLN